MGINKVQYGNTTLIDLTADTVTADKLMQGYTAHDRSGALITGTATGGSAVVSQDQDGYLVLDDEAGEAPTIASLNVTQNGTYTAPTGVAYSPVTVNVEAEPNLLARYVDVSTSQQVITAESALENISSSTPQGTKTAGSALNEQTITPHNLTLDTKYRVVATFTVIDGDDVTQQTINVDDAFLYKASNIEIYNYNNDSSSYIQTIELRQSSGKVQLRFTWNKTAYFKVAYRLQFYDLESYDGLSSVTVGGGYDSTLIKNFIERSISFTDFTFPEGITSIGNYAFMDCYYLALTSLPNTVTNIETYAFSGCSGLKLTSLPSGLTRIRSSSFQNCPNLALTSLPSGVTQIDSSAFSSCSALALTSLPSALTRIDSYAFRYCYNISISTLPSTLTYIGSNAFERCVGITSISCTGSITNLGATAFNGNSSYPMQLTSASFPNMALTSSLGTVFGYTTAANACQQLEFCDIGSTTGIAANSFANCYKLQTLVLRKTSAVCTLANVSAFLNTPMRGYNSLTGTVYVPSDLISSYQTATNWSTLYNDGTVTFVAIEGSEYEL